MKSSKQKGGYIYIYILLSIGWGSEMIMQEVHVHVCVEVCSSSWLASGIILVSIIIAPAMKGWSDKERETCSKARARLLRYDAHHRLGFDNYGVKRRSIIDSQGYVSINDICDQLIGVPK